MGEQLNTGNGGSKILTIFFTGENQRKLSVPKCGMDTAEIYVNVVNVEVHVL